MAYNVFRPLSGEEKQEITELGATDILNLFLKEKAKVMTKYHRKYRPFDDYSARIDFDMKLKNHYEELANQVNKEKKELDFSDLDKYAEPSRFEFLGKSVIRQDKLLDGIRQPTVTGYRFFFRAKSRGNKLSIFVPVYDSKSDKVDKMQRWVDENMEKAEDFVNDENMEPEDVGEDTSSEETKEVKKDTKSTKKKSE